MPDFDQKALRQAFGSFMTGVTVVTATAPDGTHVGFTANSFTSVSMDPPLLLVCPGHKLSSIGVFRECENFAITILAEGQEHVSNCFASSRDDRFDAVDWTLDPHGVPIITGSAAHFSCSVHQRMDAGDHMILIGEVQHFARTNRLGLGYGNGDYFSLPPKHDRKLELKVG